jgi:eukaryotic-like serine/threonine-protein kinase
VIGQTLGSYRVLDKLGAGGMGEVYRARDTRLGREVAIKVLPADWLADDHRRRRFLHEARLLSTLNHPHIVTIHEIESVGDIDFIVMELVRGTPLDALLPKQGLRLNELLRIAIPVADALATAHARGIIHRDLKPANIIVADNHTVKVLDFGLAKLLEADEEPGRETATDLREVALTAAGRIAGTAAYMAPEQALGGKLDVRSDIFSFGALLYEMATGTRAFVGDSTADTLAAVLNAQPKPPTQIVARLPRELERLILRCLKKEPERRYQSMLDVRNELQEIKEETDSSGGPARFRVVPRDRSAIVAAFAAALLLIAAAGWLLWPRGTVQPTVMRVVPLTVLEGWERMPAFSPDGEQVVFDYEPSGERRDTDLYITMVGSQVVRRLTSDPAVEANAAWSRDGRQIAFGRRRPDDQSGHVHVTSPLGGPDRRLSDFPVFVGYGGQISWSPDGRYIAAARWRPAMPTGESTGIYLLPTQSGEPRQLTHATAPANDRDPAFSPDGRRLAYLRCKAPSFASCDVMVVNLDAQLAVRGAPRRLTSLATYMFGLTWTRDGTDLIFGTQALAGIAYLWRVDAEGRQAPERLELAGLGASFPSTVLSRDRLVFARVGDNMDVYRIQPGTTPRANTTSSFAEFQAAFSPDGRRLAFCSSRSGESVEIWVAAADGSDARQLTHGPGRFQEAPRWSPEGRTIAFSSEGLKGKWQIWTIDVGGGPPRQLTRGAGNHRWPSWSRDGRHIYFERDAGRGPNIWRMHVDSGREQQITVDGGTIGLESADGKSLLYLPSLDSSKPLMTKPLTGAPPKQLLACVRRWFSVGSRGIYYAACSEGEPTVRLIDAATGEDRSIATLVDPVFGDPAGLTVSPDGADVLYTRAVIKGSDLMMIENFR